MILSYERIPLQLSKKKILDNYDILYHVLIMWSTCSCKTVVKMWKFICFSFSNLYRPNFLILDNNCGSAAGNAI